MTLSLNARLLLASSLVLAGFLGGTGAVLDTAFRDSAETALRDRLQGQVYALLAASDLDGSGRLALPAELPDPRLSLIGSGLYAEVQDEHGAPAWRSKSLLGRNISYPPAPALGARAFARVHDDRNTPLYSLGFTVSWETEAGREQRYTYRVSENLASFNAQVKRFRTSLWGWLGAAALLLLISQALVLRWSLAPLRRVADELRAIESGLAQRLGGRYPRELKQLTDNLNGLLENADSHLKRYRDSLGNLAHSLKTPLAVLRGAVDGERDSERLRALAREQLDAMTYLIEHQLQRAAAAGRRSLAAPVEIAPLAAKIVTALAKVYADKGVRVAMEIAPDARFHGDAGDLTELLGNLLDNAHKWCRGRVRLRAHRIAAAGALPAALEIVVEDDGPGVPEELQARVLQRGTRADESTPGHGLGLAMVQDAVTLYGGELTLGQSELGGLAVRLRFPQPAA